MHLPRLVLASVCTVLFASTASYADTLTRSLSQSIDYSGTGPIEDFGGIALFDPDLGTLNSVTQTLTGTVTFVANGSGSSYTFNVNGPGTPITTLLTFTASGTLNVRVTSGPTLEESSSQFGQQYAIEPFDVSINNGTLISNGPVTDSFIFDYTPASAVTPEPSSLFLLGTGLLGFAGVIKRRLA